MRIGIQTWGSYGDIRPFVALAKSLQTSVHVVTMVTTSIFDKDNERENAQHFCVPAVGDFTDLL